MVSLNDVSVGADINLDINVASAATEDLIARLTLAAYDAALRQGIQGNFTDLQLEIWREIGQVIRQFQRETPAGRIPHQAFGRDWSLEDSLS